MNPLPVGNQVRLKIRFEADPTLYLAVGIVRHSLGSVEWELNSLICIRRPSDSSLLSQHNGHMVFRNRKALERLPVLQHFLDNVVLMQVHNTNHLKWVKNCAHP
jgi:hypothetical protein